MQQIVVSLIMFKIISDTNHAEQCKMLVDGGGVQILNKLQNLSEENLQLKLQILENINAWENLRNA